MLEAWKTEGVIFYDKVLTYLIFCGNLNESEDEYDHHDVQIDNHGISVYRY